MSALRFALQLEDDRKGVVPERDRHRRRAWRVGPLIPGGLDAAAGCWRTGSEPWFPARPAALGGGCLVLAVTVLAPPAMAAWRRRHAA